MKMAGSLIAILIAFLFVGCDSKNKDVEYFNGELVYRDISAQADTLAGEAIVLEEECVGGMVTVLDSLIFFYSPTDKHYSYHCYNYKTGKHIGDFFPIGRGHNEFLNVTPIYCVSMYKDTAKSVFYIKEPFDQIQIDSKSNVLLAYNQFTNKLYGYALSHK